MSVSLSEHLPLLATAPDGIKKLRGLILELAVRGKLVSQDSSDEPASELLKRIAAEKARLVAEGKIKKDKPLAAVGEDEKPFELPAGWEWVRLGILLKKIGAGSTPLGGKQVYTSTGIKFLRSQNVWDDGLRLCDVALIPEDVHQKMSGTHVESGDLLFNITGASIGRCAVVLDDFDTGNVSQHVTIIRPLSADIRHFLHKLLISRHVQQTVMDVQVGVSREGLSIGKLAQFIIPLPPLAEQHRIVAKVDELMVLCDRMEAEQADAEAAHATLVQTLLGTLTQSRDAAELAANWQRLSQHFDTLFTTEASLDALKQTILQLAVMGKLVPQDPNDKSTQLGLSNAFETRRALVKKGALAKKCLTETAWLTEPPFAIPEQWEFAYFDHLAAQRSNALKAGPFGSALKKDCYVPHGYKIYGQEQVIKQDAFFGDYYINENKFNQLKSCEACPGDLLISLVGTIGKVLILPPNAEPGIINPRLIKMSLNRDLVDPAYIRVLLAAPWVREFLFAESHGSTMDVLNLTILRSLPIPLPPLAEQHCIVAKVDELMALCDSLKADLAESRARQARLATTLIESALQAA